MSFLAVIKLLLTLASALLNVARQRQAISDAEAKILAANMEKSLDLLRRASKARDDALRDFDARDGVPDDDDPNLRD